MAHIDFSNAKIEDMTNSVWGNQPYLCFEFLGIYGDGQAYLGNFTRTKINETLTKVSYVIEGTFAISGTEVAFYYYNTKFWRVYNISFNAGDTCAFQVDFEISVE